MTQALELLRTGFVQDALKAAVMVALLCSFLGVFVVLKRIVFVGAALAEVSSLGAALALFPPVVTLVHQAAEAAPALSVLEHYGPVIFALAFMLAAVAFFARASLSRNLPREAVIGAVYAGAVGLTILVLSANPSGREHAMEVLNGNIIGVAKQEIAEVFWVGLGIALIQFLFYKEFVLVSFDPEVARTLGYRSARWELVWYLTLGVMIAVSIHVAGTVLVFAYLVIPPAAALLLSRRLAVVSFASVGIGVLATLAGVLASVSFDLPTGPAIVGCLSAILALCWAGRRAIGAGSALLPER